MDHDVDSFQGLRHHPRVADVASDVLYAWITRALSRRFEIQQANPRAGPPEASRQMRAQESRAAGDQDGPGHQYPSLRTELDPAAFRRAHARSSRMARLRPR